MDRKLFRVILLCCSCLDFPSLVCSLKTLLLLLLRFFSHAVVLLPMILFCIFLNQENSPKTPGSFLKSKTNGNLTHSTECDETIFFFRAGNRRRNANS